MKQCRTCKIYKEPDSFYKRSSNLDGLYSYCKECCSINKKNDYLRRPEDYKKHREKYKEKNREKLREKSRIYYQNNKEKCIKRVSEYRKKNKKKISLNEAQKRFCDSERFERNRQKYYSWAKYNREKLNLYAKEWYRKNKEKRRAHVLLNRAVKGGKVIRPEKCSECKKECKPDGHHEDYNQPMNVIWLCRACHSRKSPKTVIK